MTDDPHPIRTTPLPAGVPNRLQGLPEDWLHWPWNITAWPRPTHPVVRLWDSQWRPLGRIDPPRYRGPSWTIERRVDQLYRQMPQHWSPLRRLLWAHLIAKQGRVVTTPPWAPRTARIVWQLPQIDWRKIAEQAVARRPKHSDPEHERWRIEFGGATVTDLEHWYGAHCCRDILL